jgi:hypothetical protein
MSRLMDVPVRTWRRAIAVSWAVMIANIAVDLTVGAAPWYIEAPIHAGVPSIAMFCSIMNVVRGRRDRINAAAAKELERKHHDEVYRLAVPDARPGQCPVCGYDDLLDQAQADAVLNLPGDPFRVVLYGSVFAHAECAQIMPYETHHKDTHVDMHQRGYHHAFPDRVGDGCAACDREDSTGTKDPIEPAADCPCMRCHPPARVLPRAEYPRPHGEWICMIGMIGYRPYMHKHGMAVGGVGGCPDCTVIHHAPGWAGELLYLAGSYDPVVRNRARELIERMRDDDQWPSL